jgi:hypothetical protein
MMTYTCNAWIWHTLDRDMTPRWNYCKSTLNRVFVFNPNKMAISSENH